MTDEIDYDDDRPYQRLSDLILEAMSLSLSQKDVAISDILSRALEMSITRNAGGAISSNAAICRVMSNRLWKNCIS